MTRMIIFIHGLGGTAEGTWANFPALMAQDEQISRRYEHIHCFEYMTTAFGMSQPLALISLELAGFIDQKVADLQLDEIAFITHSQGGLLARRYLCDCLTNDPAPCRPIFRLLTFATPHWGAYSDKIGSFIPKYFSQVKDLAYDSDSIHALNNDWSRTDAEDRIRVLRVIANDDAVVPKFSSLGANYQHFFKVVPNYGHVDIVKVQDPNHPSFGIAKVFLLEPTSSQPALVNADTTPPVLVKHWHGSDDLQGNSRFVYLSRYVALVGREKEKNVLTAFLHSPVISNATSKAAWILIQGVGGVGKSRLALEFCLAWQADWHAGFLSPEADEPDWARWQPRLPTLLVIDYATTDTKRLGRLLRGLCNRDPDYELRRPVRVVLLDRPNNEALLEEAIGRGAGSIGVNACRQPGVDLVTVDDPLLIVEDFLRQANQPLTSAEHVRQTLARIDRLRRPLFAMLLADAIIQKVSLGSLTQKSLLENVLNREREQFWRVAADRAGITLSKAQRLLGFATVVNGLSLEDVDAPLEAWDPDSYSPLFTLMSGYDCQTDQIAPVTPDILGECFALQELAKHPSRAKQATVDFAWERWPRETFGFFDRAAQDFPDDAIFTFLIKSKPPTPKGREAWAAWVVNFIGKTAARHPERSLLAFRALSEFASQGLEAPEIRLRRHQAAVNVLSDLSPSHPKIAKSIYKELGTFPIAADEADMRIAFAMATFNLMNGLTFYSPHEAFKLYECLQKFADDYLDEPELRYQEAHALLTLVQHFADTNPLLARQLLSKLRGLLTAYPDVVPDLNLADLDAAARKP